MSQNLQVIAKFQEFQLDNLVDFERCCKTRIFLQKSVPIQPKTSNILPKICQPTLSESLANLTLCFSGPHRAGCAGGSNVGDGASRRGVWPALGEIQAVGTIDQNLAIFCRTLPNFGGVFLGWLAGW